MKPGFGVRDVKQEDKRWEDGKRKHAMKQNQANIVTASLLVTSVLMSGCRASGDELLRGRCISQGFSPQVGGTSAEIKRDITIEQGLH